MKIGKNGAAEKISEAVAEGFSVEKFIENFDVLAESTGGADCLRKLILQLAVRGRLVPQDSHDESATVLSLHNGWPRRRLSEVAESRLGEMLDKEKNRGDLLPYLRNTNVHWFRIDMSSIKTMPFQPHEVTEYELRRGDVLVCEGGHGIGRTAVWSGERAPMMFQKALHRLRPSPWMDSTFLAYQLKVAADTDKLAQYFTGAGILHLTGRSLSSFEVVVPPLEEQRRIVAKVEQLLKLCDDLEARLRRAEDRASRFAEAVVRDLVA